MLVYGATEGRPLLYANPAAARLLPAGGKARESGTPPVSPRFQDARLQALLFGELDSRGAVAGLSASLMGRDGEPLPFCLYGNVILCGGSDAYALYLLPAAPPAMAATAVPPLAESGIQGGALLQTVSDNIDSRIYLCDVHTYELLFVNKATEQMIGAGPYIGKKCYELLQEGFDAPCSFCPLRTMLDADGNVIVSSYTWEHQNTKNWKWYLAKDSLFELNGRLVHMQVATDISYQKHYEEQLKYFASMDMLTGVHNREWGYRVLEDVKAGLHANEEGMSLVFLDVDGLKRVNDNLGHHQGDNLLKKTVEVVRSCIRRSDYIFRWGGDEFILLLKCEPAIAAGIMKNIDARMLAVNSEGKLPFNLSISYGIADLRQNPQDSIDKLVTRADHLMYENKMKKKREQHGA